VGSRSAGQTPDKQGKWVGLDVPDFNAFLAPDAKGGDKPSSCGPTSWRLFSAPSMTAHSRALRAHRIADAQPPLQAAEQSRGQDLEPPDQKNDLAAVASKDYPYVITTYRSTEHHLSGVMSRYLPMLAELFESHFAEISLELAKELGIANGDKVTVSSPRGKIVARAMVTNRLKPFKIDGKTVHQIGCRGTGDGRVSTHCREPGDITNDLSATVGDPTVYIQETKAFLCNVKKVEV
jgi:formate dehydrogenase major subunit